MATFDNELLSKFNASASLIQNYRETDHRHFLERETSNKLTPHAVNPYSDAYRWFVEGTIMQLMEERTIRAWHYTRLLDHEVALLQDEGVYVSTLEKIRHRLDALVTLDVLLKAQADALFLGSPFHNEHFARRSNMFWMSSNPLPVGNSEVTGLLNYWGGESVYFNLRDKEHLALVSRIGKARVIELAVPIRETAHKYEAAKAVTDTFARSRRCPSNGSGFDLYVKHALPPAAIVAVHTEGEQSFANLGNGYNAQSGD